MATQLQHAHSIAAERISERAVLSADQVAEFTRQGYLVLDTPQISETDLNWCRRTLMSLFERRVGQKEGKSFDISKQQGATDGRSTPQLFRPSLYAPELSRWDFRATALGIARQLLGPHAMLAADNSVYKPSKLGGRTPWHQDEAHNDTRRYQEQVTIWIAMFDTNEKNGAMAFIPGSHLKGILPHRPNGGSEDANAIECYEGFDPKDAKVCPLRAGGLTIHHGRTVHGAAENTSDGPRLGYILNFKTPPRPRPELGTFTWNKAVGKSVQQQRRSWLWRGGFFIEFVRFCTSDPVNRRHFLRQVAKRLRF